MDQIKPLSAFIVWGLSTVFGGRERGGWDGVRTHGVLGPGGEYELVWDYLDEGEMGWGGGNMYKILR